MKTKNLSGLLLGTTVTSRRPPALEMVVIARGTFALAPNEPIKLIEGLFPLCQGAMTGDVFEEDDEEHRGEVVYSSDFAAYKPRADLLLRGACYAPGGAPVRECPVRFVVGSFAKNLRVIGPRVFSDDSPGAVISSPIPFTRMALSYKNSFGGPGYEQNPVGKGYGTRELPTIEGAVGVKSRGDRPEPAGFGPLSPHWSQRRRALGHAYGRPYREARAPFYSEDFDFAYFNAAPPDQRLPGFLRGDEDLLFQNLHPTLPILKAGLPGLRVRAFVNDREKRFREVPLSLDTLFADLEQQTVTLTWRGLDRVKEDDLSDVQTILLASEAMAEAPRAARYYNDQLDAFERDPLELKALGLESPPHAPLDEAELDPIKALQPKLDRLSDPDRERVLRAVTKAIESAKPHADIGPAIIAALHGAEKKPSAPVVAMKPGVMPPARRRSLLRPAVLAAEKAQRAAEKGGVALPGIEAISALALSDEREPGRGDRPADPATSHDFSEQDLSYKNLSGRDLRGANFEGAILTGASLRGSSLAGARFTYANLCDADLSGADLTGADFAMAILYGARASGAIFRRAILDYAFFGKADLSRADLSEAKGESTYFPEADLTRAKALRCHFHQAIFEGSRLPGADFSEAHLTRCFFGRAVAREAHFTGATLTKTSFAGATLERASIADAHGEGTIWQGAALSRADFSFASLPSSHFTESSADEANFFGADLRACRFYRASLARADMSRSNLFEADLCKAVLSGAKLVNANLYGAKLLQASGVGSNFTGANLKRSTLEEK
jgi:uncharacterized protein YjbI with pentapeptide repeats